MSRAIQPVSGAIDLLDDGIALFREHLTLLGSLALLAAGPAIAAGIFFLDTLDRARYAGFDTREVGAEFGWLLALLLLPRFAARAALQAAACDGIEGRPGTIAGAVSAAVRRWPGVLVLGCLSLWLAFLVPVLGPAAAGLALTAYVRGEAPSIGGAFVQGWKQAWARLGDAFRLCLLLLLVGIVLVVNGRVGVALLLGLAGAFGGAMTEGAAQALTFGNPVFLAVLAGGAWLCVDALWAAAMARLYVDVQARRRGFDLEQSLAAIMARTA